MPEVEEAAADTSTNASFDDGAAFSYASNSGAELVQQGEETDPSDQPTILRKMSTNDELAEVEREIALMDAIINQERNISQANRSVVEESEAGSISELSVHSLPALGTKAKRVNGKLPSVGSTADVDSDDEDDAEVMSFLAENSLPANNDSALALNQAYQEVVEQYLAKIQGLLVTNRERQQSIQVEIAKSTGTQKKTITKVPVQVYLPPYFKNTSGMGPPRNPEAMRKAECNELNPLVQPPKKWTRREHEKLIAGVKECLLEKLLKPYLNQKELVTEKLKVTPDSERTKRAELTEAFEAIDAQINQLKCIPDEQLLTRESYADVDWMKIATIDLGAVRTPYECELMWANYLRPGINRNAFSKAQELRLKDLVEKQGETDWDIIALRLGSGYTAFQCFEKYQSNLNESLVKRTWTKEEDAVLCHVVNSCRLGNFVPWDQVAYYVEGRTRSQCQLRYTRSLDPNLRRGKWSEEEDLLLVAAVQKFGPKEWNKIAEFVPGRTDTQCRERWVGTMDASLKVGTWDQEEDDILMSFVKTFGVGQWATISRLLPGRNPTNCKQRYNRIMNAITRARKNGQLLVSDTFDSATAPETIAMINNELKCASNASSGGTKKTTAKTKKGVAALAFRQNHGNSARIEQVHVRRERVRQVFTALGGVLPPVEQPKVDKFIAELPPKLKPVIQRKLDEIRQKHVEYKAKGVAPDEELLLAAESNASASSTQSARLDRQLANMVRRIAPAIAAKAKKRSPQRDTILAVLKNSFANGSGRPYNLPPTFTSVSGFRSLLLERTALKSIGGWALLPQPPAAPVVSTNASSEDEAGGEQQPQRRPSRKSKSVAIDNLKQMVAAIEREDEDVEEDGDTEVLANNVEDLDAFLPASKRRCFSAGSSVSNGIDTASSSTALNGEAADVAASGVRPPWLDQVVQSAPFQELERNFRALFLWPAILSGVDPLIVYKEGKEAEAQKEGPGEESCPDMPGPSGL